MPTLLDIFQFAGQGIAEPCSAMDAEQGSAVHFGTHLKNSSSSVGSDTFPIQNVQQSKGINMIHGTLATHFIFAYPYYTFLQHE